MVVPVDVPSANPVPNSVPAVTGPSGRLAGLSPTATSIASISVLTAVGVLVLGVPVPIFFALEVLQREPHERRDGLLGLGGLAGAPEGHDDRLARQRFDEAAVPSGTPSRPGA